MVGGYAPTLLRCDYKEPVKIMVEKVEWVNRGGVCYAEEGDGIVTARPHKARKTVMDKVSFAVTCSSPNGVVVMDKDARILKPQRTEYGKKIRKDYESGKVDCQWKDMREMVPSDEPYSNTITTVVKDNIVMINKIKVAGELTDSKVIQDKQVYSEEGVSPTIVGAGGSGSKIKIECSDDLVSLHADGRTVNIQGDDVAAMHTPGRIIKRQNDPRIKNDGTSFTLTSCDKDGVAHLNDGKLRIRYLTPRECLRLQAFPDDAIDRLQSVLSKTALYKVAGNSIAVCCLKAIFKGIYIDRTFRKDRQTSLDRFFL